MATFSNVGKIAYIYNDGTWYPVAGMTDSSADFDWTGTHTFSESIDIAGTLTIDGPIVNNGALNYFPTVSDRTNALSSPSNGTISMVPVDGVMQPTYYYNGAWRLFGSNAFIIEKTSGYTISLSDAGKSLDFNVSSLSSVTVPLNSSVPFPIGTQIAFIQSGSGQIQFVPSTSGGTTVNIYSKNSNKKTSTRYTQAILVKKATDTWYLFGDLTA